MLNVEPDNFRNVSECEPDASGKAHAQNRKASGLVHAQNRNASGKLTNRTGQLGEPVRLPVRIVPRELVREPWTTPLGILTAHPAKRYSPGRRARRHVPAIGAHRFNGEQVRSSARGRACRDYAHNPSLDCILTHMNAPTLDLRTARGREIMHERARERAERAAQDEALAALSVPTAARRAWGLPPAPPRLIAVRCAVCDREFEARRYSNRPRFCSRHCSCIAARRRAAFRAGKTYAALPARPAIRTCVICGAGFSARRPSATHCGPSCRQTAYRLRLAARVGRPYRRRPRRAS